jgi:hypothetical protein
LPIAPSDRGIREDLIKKEVKNMKDMLYDLMVFMDEIVDSGNMILAEVVFLLFAIISLLATMMIHEAYFFVFMVSLTIAILLWLYHGIVRGDSIY